MSVFSAVVNGQLVPVAPANAVSPPSAPTPLISQGAGANNLPGFGRMGGATNGPTGSTVAASGGSGMSSGEAPTVAGAVGNVWGQPVWNNPLALTIIMLVAAYVLLRFVHWRS